MEEGEKAVAGGGTLGIKEILNGKNRVAAPGSCARVHAVQG